MKLKSVVVFLFVILIISCREDKLKPTIDQNLGSGELPVQESWNAEIQFSDGDRIKAILYAGHLYVFQNQKVTNLEEVKINFFDSEGNITSTLTSKKGKVDDLTKNMFAIDSVVAINDSGVVLKTEELIWKNRERKITTDKFVTIDDGDDHMEGYGFVSDESLSNYTIYKVTYITTKKK